MKYNNDNDDDDDDDNNNNQPYLVRVTLNNKADKPVALISGSNWNLEWWFFLLLLVMSQLLQCPISLVLIIKVSALFTGLKTITGRFSCLNFVS